MGKYKHYKGSIGGGVDISGKSKMSGKAKSLMSFPGGMPGPGEYGKMKQPTKIVGKSMARYLAGESVGMRKMDPMYNGKPGVQQDDFEQFDVPKSTGPAKERTAVKSVNEIDGKKDNYSYQKPVKTETLKEVKKPRKASKEIGKSKIEAGKKLKKEGRQEKRAARKDARKSKRSARLDKKIALQEFKGKQAKDGKEKGINSKALRKSKRVDKLKARKAKK